MLKNKPWLSWFLSGLLGLLILGGVGFVVWANHTPPLQDEALQALNSTQVLVTPEGGLQFQPRGRLPETGLIFYPGGRVDPRAYAPAARDMAAAGFLVVIPSMPLNLAVLNINAAVEVMGEHPDIQRWVIGGHSLGGAMAAAYAGNHPDTVEGLALWAAFPGTRTDLSGTDLQVISIYGTRDGLATPEEVTDAVDRLPGDTRWVPIAGGNHAGFGWYGPQRGDRPATISQEEQQKQILQAMLHFLSDIEG